MRRFPDSLDFRKGVADFATLALAKSAVMIFLTLKLAIGGLR